MEWSNELIFEFLKLYQQEPTLWNTTTPEHKNKIDAHEAWRRIKDKLKDGNIPIREIKKKRDNLMSTYRRQSRRVRESMEQGNGEEVYKPEWPFYSVMAAFLDDVYKPKKFKRSEDALETDEEYSIDDEERQPKFKTPNSLQKKSKRVKQNDYDDPMAICEESFNLYQEYPQNPEIDTCSLYCNFLCSKLRALKENTRDIAMMEIDRLLYNLKQQDLVGVQYQNIIPPILQPGFCHSSVPFLPNQNYSQLKQEWESNPSPDSPQQILVTLSPVDFPASNSQTSSRHNRSCDPSDPHSLQSRPSPQQEQTSESPEESNSPNSQS